jgi:hypothetical protein
MSPQKTKLKCKKSGCRRQTDLQTTVFRTAKLFCSASYYYSSDYGYYVTDTPRPEAFFQTPPHHRNTKKNLKNIKNIRGIYQKKLENVSTHLLQSAEQQQQSLPLASAATTCTKKNREILADSPNPNFFLRRLLLSSLGRFGNGRTAATAWFPPHRTAFTQERMDRWMDGSVHTGTNGWICSHANGCCNVKSVRRCFV